MLVCTMGLGRAQTALAKKHGGLAPLEVTSVAVREATGVSFGLQQLLQRAVAGCDDEMLAQMPVMLDLERTGLPATARYEAVARAVRLSPNTIRQEKRAAWSALLASVLVRMHVDACASARVRFEVSASLRSRTEALCTFAALQLVALRRRDGSWAASGNGGAGELSTTAWAATSLHKALGAEWAKPALQGTLDWVTAHHDPQRGGFGVRYPPLGPPGVRLTPQIVPQPRQTASAIKLMRQFDGARTRRVGLGVKYILEHQARDGIGWASSGHNEDAADLLTTVYVLDALLVLAADLCDLSAVLDDADFAVIEDRFERVVRRGLDWVHDSRRDGGWADGSSSEPDPYVTAQVLGFAWQALQTHTEPTIRYLERHCRDGGLPAYEGGPPAIAPTAIALLGLMRATNQGHERLLQKAASFMGRMTDQPDPSPDVFAATFSLLLGESPYAWLAGDAWQDRARAGAQAIMEGVDARRSPDEIAASALVKLDPSHHRVAPALKAWLAAGLLEPA